MKLSNEIEKKTARLFPQIHTNNTPKDIEAYRFNTQKVFDQFFKNENENYLQNKLSLEVGCGGRCAGINLLSKLELKEIHAIDLSPENISSTHEIVKNLSINNSYIKQGNALSISYDSDTFDFVMSDGVIHHTLNTRKALIEITRVLKPGGIVFLGIYGYGGILGMIFPLGKYIGKIVPFELMFKLATRTGFLRSQEYSILDWFYTPIQRNYRASTIISWLDESRYTEITIVKSTKWWFNMGVLSDILFGDGYLYFFAKKFDYHASQLNT